MSFLAFCRTRTPPPPAHREPDAEPKVTRPSPKKTTKPTTKQSAPPPPKTKTKTKREPRGNEGRGRPKGANNAPERIGKHERDSMRAEIDYEIKKELDHANEIGITETKQKNRINTRIRLIKQAVQKYEPPPRKKAQRVKDKELDVDHSNISSDSAEEQSD